MSLSLRGSADPVASRRVLTHAFGAFVYEWLAHMTNFRALLNHLYPAPHPANAVLLALLCMFHRFIK